MPSTNNLAKLTAAFVLSCFSPDFAFGAEEAGAPGIPKHGLPGKSPEPVREEVAADSVKIADGIVKATAYEKTTESWVATNNAGIQKNFGWTQNPETVGMVAAGEKITSSVKVKGASWILVEKDGVGIGYLSRGVVAPVGSSPHGAY